MPANTSSTIPYHTRWRRNVTHHTTTVHTAPPAVPSTILKHHVMLQYCAIPGGATAPHRTTHHHTPPHNTMPYLPYQVTPRHYTAPRTVGHAPRATRHAPRATCHAPPHSSSHSSPYHTPPSVAPINTPIPGGACAWPPCTTLPSPTNGPRRGRRRYAPTACGSRSPTDIRSHASGEKRKPTHHMQIADIFVLSRNNECHAVPPCQVKRDVPRRAKARARNAMTGPTRNATNRTQTIEQHRTP